MKLLLAATLVLVFSSMDLAVPDSQQVGPYAVSFDIDANYQPHIAQPIEEEMASAYQMRLFVDNSTFAVIGITEYAEPTDSTLVVHKTMMPMNMIIREGLNATDVEEMTIDGREGFVITSEPFQISAEAPNGQRDHQAAAYARGSCGRIEADAPAHAGDAPGGGSRRRAEPAEAQPAARSAP